MAEPVSASSLPPVSHLGGFDQAGRLLEFDQICQQVATYTRTASQMRRLYDKTCEAVRAQLSPVAAKLNYVLLGGDRFTLNGCLKVCPALAALGSITLKRRLNIRDPKRDTLEQVGLMLRESRVWTVEW